MAAMSSGSLLMEPIGCKPRAQEMERLEAIGDIGTPAVSPIGKPVEKRVIKQEIERRPVRFVGRTDLENMTGGADSTKNEREHRSRLGCTLASAS